jgi:2-oxo-4-hydroxy-4-carboxy-5-ureidoimidazoline decarboxylase
MDPWRRIDEGSEDEARQILERACGSPRWVARMLAGRPFGSQPALLSAARREWSALSKADWIAAFDHHPRIGDMDALRQRFAATRDLSEREQAGARGALAETLARLAERNRAYEKRFGYIFIVCATGLTAEEILTRLESRLGNEPDLEIGIAAEEQAKITALRLGA